MCFHMCNEPFSDTRIKNASIHYTFIAFRENTCFMEKEEIQCISSQMSRFKISLPFDVSIIFTENL